MSARMITLYWVSLPYATFLIVSEDGRVMETAPIARWATGQITKAILDYYRRKGADILRIDSE